MDVIPYKDSLDSTRFNMKEAVAPHPSATLLLPGELGDAVYDDAGEKLASMLSSLVHSTTIKKAGPVTLWQAVEVMLPESNAFSGHDRDDSTYAWFIGISPGITMLVSRTHSFYDTGFRRRKGRNLVTERYEDRNSKSRIATRVRLLLPDAMAGVAKSAFLEPAIGNAAHIAYFGELGEHCCAEMVSKIPHGLSEYVAEQQVAPMIASGDEKAMQALGFLVETSRAEMFSDFILRALPFSVRTTEVVDDICQTSEVLTIASGGLFDGPELLRVCGDIPSCIDELDGLSHRVDRLPEVLSLWEFLRREHGREWNERRGDVVTIDNFAERFEEWGISSYFEALAAGVSGDDLVA